MTYLLSLLPEYILLRMIFDPVYCTIVITLISSILALLSYLLFYLVLTIAKKLIDNSSN